MHLDAIEAHFRARCAGVIQVPWDRALQAGARTAPEDLRPATRAASLELAALVAEGFRDEHLDDPTGMPAGEGDGRHEYENAVQR